MDTKKSIKLTESKLKQIISECVKEALNEISYSTVKSAYDKMNVKGQPERAKKLSKSFYTKYNNDDIQYDIEKDQVSLLKDPKYYGDKDKKYHTFKNGDTRTGWEKSDEWFGNGQLQTANYNHHITTSPSKARKYASAVQNYRPNTKLTRDDFRK